MRNRAQVRRSKFETAKRGQMARAQSWIRGQGVSLRKVPLTTMSEKIATTRFEQGLRQSVLDTEHQCPLT